ncbi:MAG: alpha/beta fold hydrolase, partial [Myxococcota bacterium]
AARRLTSLFARPLPRVALTPRSVVYRENKCRLLRFTPEKRRFDVPVLMVPSMINRWYVLDLCPGRSLVEWLLEQGHEVYVLDWGTPADEDRFVTFDEYIGGYLRRALRKAAELGDLRDVETKQAHVLGYCMGGTLALILGAVYPERFASLTALASPVAFDEDDLLGAWTRSEDFDVEAFAGGMGNAPWPLLQSAFNLLRPTLHGSKLTFLADQAVQGRRWNDAFLDSFFAKERWANDNVAIPSDVFRRWILDIYRANALVNGSFLLDGHRVDLGALTMPLHVITFQDDYIVPRGAAEPLARLSGSRDLTANHLRGGHVGAVVSGGARKALWPLMANWWQARD